MTKEEIENLKTDLKAVLDKYKIGIDFTVGECSDTYGMVDCRMTIVNQDGEIIVDSIQDWYLSSNSDCLNK
jgi:hypothetical protein